MKFRTFARVMKRFWKWLLAGGMRERKIINSAEKLQLSIRTTAKCRYNAAVRLKKQATFSFFTTTFLSLGLVFIPLMQNSGVPLAFEANVLNMMQIFLGVSVLVYSVVIGTARYDMRSEQLTECGNQLKILIRALDVEIKLTAGKVSPQSLSEFQKQYSDTLNNCENHNRNDYRYASLEMENDYFLTGAPRLWLHASSLTTSATNYILPLLLMLMEVVFITDMIAVTQILTPYLNGKEVQQVKRSAELSGE